MGHPSHVIRCEAWKGPFKSMSSGSNEIGYDATLTDGGHAAPHARLLSALLR
jgi:hypothetical protein